MRTRIAAGCFAILCFYAGAQGRSRNRGQPDSPAASNHAPAPRERVDINRADVDELMKVPGMARTWAERIVRFRPYRSRQDLLDRGVVPSDVYDRIKDYLIAHKAKP